MMKYRLSAASLVMAAAGCTMAACGVFVPTAHAQTVEFACPYHWTTDLKIGSKGPEVRALQQFLNQNATTTVAVAGAGSPGHESDRYGALTARSVTRFQEMYRADVLDPQHLTAGTGRVGAATRTKLNALCDAMSTSATSTTVTTAAAEATTTPLLMVTNGKPITPTIAVANALRIPFTSLTVEARGGDVTINSITIAQVGPADRRAFSTVSLLDADGYVLSYGYLNADNQVVLKDPIDVPAGTTMPLVVAGDMSADTASYDNQLAGLNVVSLDATASTTGSFPITGAFNTINGSLIIGTASTDLSPIDPNGDRGYFINDKNIIFAAIRLTADSVEDEVLRAITWEQAGSASASDIARLETVVNGRSHPTELDGRSYTTTFDEPIVIPRGNTIDLQLVGDLGTTGSNRTAKFDIRWADDIVVNGKTFGYGLWPVPDGNTATEGSLVFLTADGTTDTDSITPFFSGSTITISPGALISVGK